MRTLRKEFLVAVLTVIVLGILGSTDAVVAKKPRKSLQKRTYYDLYVVQGAKTFRLPQGDLTFKTALSLGPDKTGFYGIPGPPGTRLDIEPIEILLFDPETAGATVQLAKLAHIETAPAHSFDLKAVKIGPAIFDKVYHVNFDEPVPINLWCVEGNIPLLLTPVARKRGWYRAVPAQKLEAGVYAINFGGIDGPRIYTGALYCYPFVLAGGPEPDNPPAHKPVP
jgi:hypothetical protein